MRGGPASRGRRWLALGVAVVALATSCGSGDGDGSEDGDGSDGGATSSEPAGDDALTGTVSALYAGSLAAVMEDNLGPAFAAATGAGFEGEAHGSLGAAQLIRDGLRTPDVFVSADPLVNEEILMGPDNDDLVEWYITFASSQMVVGYSPNSPHVDQFEALERGEIEWYEILGRDDVTFGRGDPTIDPKGYRTLFMFDLAAAHYGDDEIVDMIGDPVDSEQVLPEVALLARVDSGQFDAGIFYRHEAVAAGLPYVTLPPEINLGDPDHADLYATVDYELPDGVVLGGAPILFTVTIPNTVQDPAAAAAFVEFLLSSEDQVEALGFGALAPRLTGDASLVPESVMALVSS